MREITVDGGGVIGAALRLAAMRLGAAAARAGAAAAAAVAVAGARLWVGAWEVRHA
jgi:hypothetical protein